MEVHTEILQVVLDKNSAELRKILDTRELSDYEYSEVSGKFGLTDANYNNRLRLSAIILLNPDIHAEIMDIVRLLMQQEIISRQKNDFQGIGPCLEILTTILKKYDNPEDKKLFESAKKANFDCACGYSPDNCNYKSELSEYDLEESILLCRYLGDSCAERELVEYWESINETSDKKNLETLRRYYKGLSDDEKELRILKKLLEISRKDENSFNRLLAASNYLKKLVEMKNFTDSFMLLDEIIKSMDESAYNSGLGRGISEAAADLIISCKEHTNSEKIWIWLRSFLYKEKNLHWNLMEKSISAAELFGDRDLADILRKRYEKEKKELRF